MQAWSYIPHTLGHKELWTKKNHYFRVRNPLQLFVLLALSGLFPKFMELSITSWLLIYR